MRYNRIRVVAGAALWLALAALIWRSHVWERPASRRWTRQLSQFARGERQQLAFSAAEPLSLAIGDPVFAHGADGRLEQVGEVRTTSATAPGDARRKASPAHAGSVLLYGSSPTLETALPEGCQLVYYAPPDSVDWVLTTMLPPAKREAIARLIGDALRDHSQELALEFQPIVEASLQEAAEQLEDDLRNALARRSQRLEQIAGRYQRELIERELVPLVRREIWPLVERRGLPIAEQVGHEIWQRASLWRFGWRYAYDLSPLPQRDLLRREWNRFLRDEAAPVVAEHVDDLIRVQQQLLRDIARNQEVQSVMRRALGQVIADPEVRQLIMDVIGETVVENDRLHDIFRKHWSGPRAQRAFQLAGRLLEPTAVEIGALLFGTPDDGVSPEFARVLRHHVLGKDRRWLVLQPAEGPVWRAVEAAEAGGRQFAASSLPSVPLVRGQLQDATAIPLAWSH